MCRHREVSVLLYHQRKCDALIEVIGPHRKRAHSEVKCQENRY